MDTHGSAPDRPAAALPECVEVETGPNPSRAVIWLHGLGADGHDFEPIVPWLAWPGAPAVRYVFPHAPIRPVTINGGYHMRAWYDILSLEGSREQDAAGIEASIGATMALIERETGRGVAPGRITLAGFSQGGAIATQAALRYHQTLAGLVVLSSYMLFADRMGELRHEANAALPAFVAHGSLDPMLPLGLGREVAATLARLGHPVEWRQYEVPHSVCEEEIADLAAWFRQTWAG